MTHDVLFDYEAALPPEPSLSSRYYGWVNLAVAAVAMVCTLPGRTQGLGIITEPLLRDLRITPIQYSVQNFWTTLLGSVFSLACGPILDRLGARVVLTAVMAALGATVIEMSHVTSAIGLFIALTLTRGLGQSALSVVSLALVGKWFSRKLPIAMAIYSLIIGIGFMIAFPGISHAVIVGKWRVVWGDMGWTLLALSIPAYLLTRRTPESVGLLVDGAAGPQATRVPEDSAAHGLDLASALRSPAFWAYALSASIFGLISSGLMLYNESVLIERGIAQAGVPIVLGIIVMTGLVANFVGGWLTTRISVGMLMAGAMLMLAIGLVALPLGHGRAAVYLYAVMMGSAAGVVTVAFFVCWGKTFGRRHLGAIQGAAQGLTVLASAAGPVLLSLSSERYHSTTPLFYAAAPVVLLLGVFCALAPVPRNT